MINTKQHALEKLKNTYSRAINSPNDRSFFISLFEYVDLFETDSLIEKARIAIFDEAKKDKTEVEKLGKKALKEIRANCQPIAEYVESKGIENEAITRSLQEYRDIEDGTTQMSGNLVQNLYDCLAEVLYRLADDKNNNKFIDKFCSLEESVNTKVLSFSPTFNLWNAIYSQYERITVQEYDRFYRSFREKITDIDIKLDMLQEAEDSYYITAKYVLDLANRAQELFENSELDERRQLIKLVLSNPVIEGDKLQYEANKPFDLLLECADQQQWLPLVDVFRTESIEFGFGLQRIQTIYTTFDIEPVYNM